MIERLFSVAEKNSIKTFEQGDPQENPWVKGKPERVHVEVVAHDPAWVTIFLQQKRSIQHALAEQALAIEHVGSTAVAHLAAKPIIDIDLIVPDPDQESQYLPALQALGFELIVREPSWYSHRMLKLAAPQVNLHVFPPHCAEHWRHILFRDWLQNHPEDLKRYAQVKQLAKQGVSTYEAYNKNKQQLIREIYQAIFQSLK